MFIVMYTTYTKVQSACQNFSTKVKTFENWNFERRNPQTINMNNAKKELVHSGSQDQNYLKSEVLPRGLMVQDLLKQV